MDQNTLWQQASGLVFGNAKTLGNLCRQGPWLNTNPTSGHFAIFDQGSHDLSGRRHRHCKANAQVATRARINGRVDAHQQTVGIDQCATRVTRIDSRICLNKIFKGVDAQLFASQGAHNARGDGLANAKGIANGQDSIAHLQTLHLTQDDGGQFWQVNFEQGQIRFGIGANDFGHGAAAIVECDFNALSALDHVVVGKDVAIWTDNHTASHARARLLVFGLFKKTKPGVCAARFASGFLLHIDANHGRCRFLGSQSKTATRHGVCQPFNSGLGQGDGFGVVNPLKPARLKGRNNEPRGQKHGDRLGKKEPKSFHGVHCGLNLNVAHGARLR